MLNKIPSTVDIDGKVLAIWSREAEKVVIGVCAFYNDSWFVFYGKGINNRSIGKDRICLKKVNSYWMHIQGGGFPIFIEDYEPEVDDKLMYRHGGC